MSNWVEEEDYPNSEESIYDEEDDALDQDMEELWRQAEAVTCTEYDSEGKRFEVAKKVLKRHVHREIMPSDLRLSYTPYGKATKGDPMSFVRHDPPVALELGRVDDYEKKARAKVKNVINEMANTEVDIKDSEFALIKLEEKKQKMEEPKKSAAAGAGGDEKWGANRNKLPPAGRAQGADDYKCKVRVTNLSDRISEDELRELFAFGKAEMKVKRVFIVKDKETNLYRGFAFVTYESESQARFAVQRGTINYKNSVLRIVPAEPQKKN